MPEAATRFFQRLIYSLWQILPLDIASGIGALLIRVISLKYHRTSDATRRTLLHINPAYTDRQLDQIIATMWQNIGRVWAEALITQRLSRHRLRISGYEHLRAARMTGRPIIVPFLHTGNWEISIPMMAAHDMAPHVSAEVQRRKFFDDLLNRVRGLNGLVVLPPDKAGTRKIFRCLQNGGTLCIALDEYKNGTVLGPPFGRRPTGPTNLDFALRLAARFNAVLLPMHVVRLRGARFELHIMPPLPPELLETGAGRDRLKQALESWGERAVKSHIDQWYMLHRLRFK